MAELEVSKHTKQLLKGLSGEKHSFRHKVQEFLFEIAIIIFAVSISIWFHSLGERRQEQQQVKTFLLGLKGDIQNDIKDINHVIEFHHRVDGAYRYLSGLNTGDKIDPQQFDKYFSMVGSSSSFEPESSRYEGFKSGGKLTNIEDEELLQKILKYYQVRWPIGPESNWRFHRDLLIDFLRTAGETIEDEQVKFKLISSPKGKFLAKNVITNDELYGRYQNTINEGNEIIKAIDHDYPDQSDKK